jgi:hypothetical protein
VRAQLECNPRTVEPGNAVASGVPIPELQLRLSTGESFAGPPVIGRPGVRTHSLMAVCLGAADHTGQRRAVIAELGTAILRRGTYRGGREVLTPMLGDPVSALALGFVVGRLLAAPGVAAPVAGRAVGAYALTAETVETISRVLTRCSR